DRVAGGAQFAGGVIAKERRPLWIGKADFDTRDPGAQSLGHAAKRAAGADRADEAVDLAARRGDDLWSGGFDMRLPVGDVVELVGPDRAVGQLLRQLRGEPARQLDVVVGVFIGLGRPFDEIGAVKAQSVLLFLALSVRD